MVADFKWNPGTGNNGLAASAFTLMADTSELASLTNTSYVVSSVSGASGIFSNVNSAQAAWAELFLTLGAIGSVLTGSAAIAGWFLRSWDGGTTFEQSSVPPPRPADFFFPLPATTIGAATTWGASGLVLVPAVKYKVGIQNNIGQTLAATGNLIRAAPVNMQTP